MAVTLMRHESEARPLDAFARDEPCVIGELSTSDEAEVFEFLSARTIHTVFMTSLIQDNGLLSPHNRGSFYSCRDRYGRLEGVALLGHATLIEARSENSLAWLGIPSSKIANSSPPSRATISTSRIQLSSRRAMVIKSWSPIECPRLSLTFLNRSRSRNKTAN